MKSENLKRKLFGRFYFGAVSEKERNKVLESKEFNDILHKNWEQAGNENHDVFFNKNGVYQIVDWKTSKNGEKRKSLFAKTFFKYAAVLVFGVLLGSALPYFFFIQPNIKGQNEIVEMNNPLGNISNLILPDGTNVALNAKSSIKYPKKFGQKNRTVELTGEAFFDVVHNPDKPFIVKTGEVDVEAIGTRFNVSAYPNDKNIEAILIEGIIGVSYFNPSIKQRQNFILSPNYKATFSKEEKHLTLGEADGDLETSWRMGVLRVDNEPFESLIRKLERKYDTQLELSDNLLGKYRFTLTIGNESLEETLKILKRMTPIDLSLIHI
jgi:ferric-dicitrate binding protein FerR (iron transport regulator)